MCKQQNTKAQSRSIFRIRSSLLREKKRLQAKIDHPATPALAQTTVGGRTGWQAAWALGTADPGLPPVSAGGLCVALGHLLTLLGLGFLLYHTEITTTNIAV